MKKAFVQQIIAGWKKELFAGENRTRKEEEGVEMKTTTSLTTMTTDLLSVVCVVCCVCLCGYVYVSLVIVPVRKKLCYLYLANDVMQRGLRKGWPAAFAPELEAAVSHVYAEALNNSDQKVTAAVRRMLGM